MLEAIREIGNEILGDGIDSKDNLLENLTLECPETIRGRKQHIVIINYNAVDKCIDVEFEEVSEETPKKYLWVGSADGSNSDQIYFTVRTNNIGHLLSQTIPNLLKRASENGAFYARLKMARDDLFRDLGFAKRNRYVLNGEKLGLLEEGYIAKCLENGRREGKKDKDLFKKIVKLLEKNLMKLIKNRTHLSKKEVALFSLRINNQPMADNPEYQSIIIKEKIDSLFQKDKKVCSCCNTFEPYTAKPKFAKAGSALGYYITDKIGFSSNLSGSYASRFVICKGCYQRLLVGEIFIRNELSSKLGGLNVYIVPKFLLPSGITPKQLSQWAEYIKFSFNSAKTFMGLEEFNERLEEFKEMETLHNNYSLNLFFWRSGTGAETKVLRLIVDVSPTKFTELTKTTNTIKDVSDKLLGESYRWHIDLQAIYYLIPLRVKKSKKETWLEYQKLLDLYDNIFCGRPVSYRFLIDQYIILARIYKFEQFDTYNIKKPERDKDGLITAILKANLFLFYLRKLNLLHEGKVMDYEHLNIAEDMKNFVREMQYDEEKVAMFLLGTLIGAIGNAQYSPQSPKKPILEKITFQGMNRNKLIRLTNEVFEKLIQYKQLPFCETQFYECKRLLDEKVNSWGLSDQENVFYILSGYAYATNRAMTAKRDKEKKVESKEGGEEQRNDN